MLEPLGPFSKMNAKGDAPSEPSHSNRGLNGAYCAVVVTVTLLRVRLVTVTSVTLSESFLMRKLLTRRLHWLPSGP